MTRLANESYIKKAISFQKRKLFKGYNCYLQEPLLFARAAGSTKFVIFQGSTKRFDSGKLFLIVIYIIKVIWQENKQAFKHSGIQEAFTIMDWKKIDGEWGFEDLECTHVPLLYTVPMCPTEDYDPLSESMIGHVECNLGWEREMGDENREEEEEKYDNDEEVEGTMNQIHPLSRESKRR